MVKSKFLFFILLIVCYVNSSPLTDKIINLVDKDDYKKHEKFINVLFKDEEKFLINSRINIVKIIKTLQDNGLFKFIFEKPVNMSVSFEVQNTDSVLLSIKSIQDVLHALGYGFFITTQAQYNNTLKWSTSFDTNVGIDPGLLNKELQKRGISINDITRHEKTRWTYKLDAQNIKLSDVYKLQKNTVIKINKRTNDIFIQPIKLSNGYSSITITSSPKNTWYPYIVFYDKKLNILKIKKVDKIIKKISTQIPLDSFYIKISDIYINKNFNNGFSISIN